MKIKLDREIFTSKFLDPITKVTGEQAKITIDKTGAACVCNTKDQNVILYAKIKAENKDIEKTEINAPNIGRLNRILGCVNADVLEFEVNTNNIEYDSDNIRFKYHLVDNGVVMKTTANATQIDKLEFDMEFTLSPKKLQEILKGSIFAENSNKIYFYVKDGKVYGELTDRSMANIDNVTYLVTDSFEGTELKAELPISLDTIRNVLLMRDKEINVRINTKLKVLMFEIKDKQYVLKYIISALVK